MIVKSDLIPCRYSGSFLNSFCLNQNIESSVKNDHVMTVDLRYNQIDTRNFLK